MTKKIPHVLFINRTYPPVSGATGRILAEVTQNFARAGWCVTVITTGAQTQQERPKKNLLLVRVKGPEHPKGPLSYARVWWRLYRAACAQEAPDLVVSMTDPPMTLLIGDAVAKRHKCPHLHWCQDVYPDLVEALSYPLPRFCSDFLRRWARGALARSSRIVVIGRCMARHLLRTYAVSARNISVIPNWPDLMLSPYRPAPEDAAPNQSLRMSGPRFRVLYAGNMGRAHDPKPILEAAWHLAEKHPEIEFLLMGCGPGIDEIAAAREKGLVPETLRLLPPQPQERLRTLLESADVHLVALKHQALGLCVPCKVYSAFAVGRPCIFIGPETSEAARDIIEFGAGAVISAHNGDAGAQLAAQILEYRMQEQAWFTAAEGSARAGRVFTPMASIEAFMERAGDLLPQESLISE